MINLPFMLRVKLTCFKVKKSKGKDVLKVFLNPACLYHIDSVWVSSTWHSKWLLKGSKSICFMCNCETHFTTRTTLPTHEVLLTSCVNRVNAGGVMTFSPPTLRGHSPAREQNV